MTTVTVYRSTDSSAPVLDGAVGALTGLLDACLVNGYGAQSAAGWTITQTGTNKRVYKNSATDGTGSSLYIDDTASGAAGAKEAFATGFLTTSGLGTGTNQFPTSGQLALGIGAVVIRKSTTADTTARAWTLVADDTVFYLFTETGDYSSPVLTMVFMFGDIFSYYPSDANRAIIIGRNNVGTVSTSGNLEASTALLTLASAAFLSNTIGGHFMAQSWTGLGGSIPVGKHTDQTKSGAGVGNAASGTSGTTTLTTGANSAIGVSNTAAFNYPNGPDGGLYLAPIWIHHSGSVRGYLKGLWAPLQNSPVAHNATFSGSGNLSGKSFLAQNALACADGVPGNTGQFIVETSSTWS